MLPDQCLYDPHMTYISLTHLELWPHILRIRDIFATPYSRPMRFVHIQTQSATFREHKLHEATIQSHLGDRARQMDQRNSALSAPRKSHLFS